MLKNYIRVALRNLRRERLYASINVIGMAVALTVSLLAYAYVKHEYSFDRFHENLDSLYRVNYLIPESGGTMQRSASTAFALSPILRERLPEVSAVVGVTDREEAIIVSNGTAFVEEFLYADSQFFSIFSFPLVAGNASTALSTPTSIVISERLATKYFGGESAFGRTILMTVDGVKQEYQITGVCKNVPGNSTLEFDMILPVRQLFSLRPELNDIGWNLTWPTTFVQLRPGASAAEVDRKLKALAATLPMNSDAGEAFSLELQPITDMHFDQAAGANRTSNPLYSYVLVGVSMLVLALACINFMTLAVGRSQTRTKEAGIRKVLGARAGQLLGRFLGEAVVLCVLAVLLAFVCAELLLPAFNRLSGKQIDPYIWLDLPTLGFAITLIAITSLCAGGYPAAILARTRLRDAVKGKAALLTGAGMTRTLVSLQFGFSIALIIIAIIMSGQLRYLQSIPVGFDKEQLVMLQLHGSGDEKLRITELMRASLAGNQHVKSVAAAYRDFDGSGMTFRDYLPDSTMFFAHFNPVDEHYVETMGLTILEGSDFTGTNSNDPEVPYLVNEALMRRLGWTSAIGKRIPGITPNRVVGVVNDFHFKSLASPVEPMALPHGRHSEWAGRLQLLYIRLAPGNPLEAMDEIRETWGRVAPTMPFEFEFMDSHIDAQYRGEQRWRQIITYAAGLAIAVACFGAFGLTALAVARRQKEIGVRKVLGASSRQIVGLLSKEFVWLVLVGNLLAWPVAFVATKSWLSEFAYHVNPTIWPFVLATLVTLVVVILTVSAQAVRAARTNPAEVIRYE